MTIKKEPAIIKHKQWVKNIQRLYGSRSQITEHIFTLRNGASLDECVWAYLEIPRDITAKEANSLCKFIKELVIKK